MFIIILIFYYLTLLKSFHLYKFENNMLILMTLYLEINFDTLTVYTIIQSDTSIYLR